jgi:catechol 2,3-dioxygenase-like lactoylglutathione lyase family enzyme
MRQPSGPAADRIEERSRSCIEKPGEGSADAYRGIVQKVVTVGGSSYDFDVRRVVSVEPIFVVSDVTRALAHYEQLGFSTSHHDEGYAFAHRNDLTIHLAGPGVDPERVGRGAIYMHVDDADALADEWRGAGVEFVEPTDFDYGKREGSHEDPDGNLIRFGSPLRRHADA